MTLLASQGYRIGEQSRQHGFWIPRALCRSILERLADFEGFLVSQVHLERLYILLEIFDFLRSRDGNYQWVLSRQPSQAELTWGAVLAFGNVRNGFGCSQVFREVLKARRRVRQSVSETR